ncbi:hypothetical protein COMA2_40243 [Candidatus Nitrospira nitrificans]|uniref:Uncharacterized protein n=1 Tax=Candidatus Nitrospira nitrificans TaxID=1742973 RepID=A0A0S4LQH4_9BACT|nr:hypothetical protein COMA2_40243 [Candidatus Nitrospira nitrificans]
MNPRAFDHNDRRPFVFIEKAVIGTHRRPLVFDSSRWDLSLKPSLHLHDLRARADDGLHSRVSAALTV